MCWEWITVRWICIRRWPSRGVNMTIRYYRHVLFRPHLNSTQTRFRLFWFGDKRRSSRALFSLRAEDTSANTVRLTDKWLKKGWNGGCFVDQLIWLSAVLNDLWQPIKDSLKLKSNQSTTIKKPTHQEW